MPHPTLAQLVLLELGGAAALGGLQFRHAWLIAGVAAAVVVALLAIVPIRERWLYQLGLAWLGLVQRRRRIGRHSGLAGLLGDYRVESVPAGSHGSAVGVVRSGSTWTLPLVLRLDGILNDDAPVPVELLTDLLQVEDVPLTDVRLFTLLAPPQVPRRAPAGPAAPLVPLAARYCLLTLDTRLAGEAIAARGGSQAAVHQILRRCAVHAEQVLSTAGLSVRRLDQAAVESLFATWLGPAAPPTGRRGAPTLESWSDVRVAGTWSTAFAVTGSGPDLPDRVARLAAAAPTPVAATALVLGRQPAREEVVGTIVVRLSAPDTAPHADAANSLALLAQAYGLTVQRLHGEQGRLMRATTPVGIAR